MGSVYNSDHRAFASSYSCSGSLKASDASALVSPTPIINMSRGQFNVDADNTNANAIPCKSVSIQDTPGSYIAAAGGSRPKPSATGGSKLDPCISKANFHLLFPENLCEGVYVSIRRKVVETYGLKSMMFLFRFPRKMALELSRLKSDVLKESLTIGVHLIEDMGFTIKIVSIPITVVTPVVPAPIFEMTNDGFQPVG
ncbi:hypothetical protein Tco_1289175 [Tanacetum coccineum]